MKKEVIIKYPNSANLFQFCRKVLDHKFGGIRVIDQDVGQILGFDPADPEGTKKAAAAKATGPVKPKKKKAGGDDLLDLLDAGLKKGKGKKK